MRNPDRDAWFQFQKVRDLVPLLEEQLNAVRNDREADPLEKARVIALGHHRPQKHRGRDLGGARGSPGSALEKPEERRMQ